MLLLFAFFQSMDYGQIVYTPIFAVDVAVCLGVLPMCAVDVHVCMATSYKSVCVCVLWGMFPFLCECKAMDDCECNCQAT